MSSLSGLLLSVLMLSAPPVSLTGAARRAAFPPGDAERAETFNRSGLSLRKKGDGIGAARAYASAIQVDPTYAPARFNLACELSRHGEVTAALDQLSLLVRLGTPAALKYVAAARFDDDFKAIWNDQRFREIQSIFVLYPALPTLAQLCESPPKVLSLIDDSVGVVVHIDDRDTMNKKVLSTTVKKGRDARSAVYKLLEDGGFCEAGAVGGDAELAIKDYPLTRDTGKAMACYEKPSFGEWDQEYGICIGMRQGRWTLVLAADYDGLAAVDLESEIPKRREQALKSAVDKAMLLLRN